MPRDVSRKKRSGGALGGFLAVQAIVAIAFFGSWTTLSTESKETVRVAVNDSSPRSPVPIADNLPLRIEPLYDDPQLVSDAQLTAVLKKVRPNFPIKERRPNFVEHALRTWGVEASFADPDVMSGEEMRDFLVDHGNFVASWGDEIPALLRPAESGISVRWGKEPGASVHHDHLLASLTEAGLPRSQKIFVPGQRNATFDSILQQALRDIRLDEREVEWSAMAFALWLPPRTSWTTGDGRQMSFDLMAKRLMRGHSRYGVCSGTHRVYSLMLMVRIDELIRNNNSQATDGLLSETVLVDCYRYLESVRDLISVSQLENGSWPGNWYDGAEAAASPIDESDHKKVIATGHHLEWLAIAPKSLHPPREQILKAANWIIQATLSKSDKDLHRQYTFYSHVGTALALWRKTHPTEFWQEHLAARGTPPD